MGLLLSVSLRKRGFISNICSQLAVMLANAEVSAACRKKIKIICFLIPFEYGSIWFILFQEVKSTAAIYVGIHDCKYLSSLAEVRWRLSVLTWGEGCTFAVGRTACNLAADLKPTWAEPCNPVPAAANSSSTHCQHGHATWCWGQAVLVRIPPPGAFFWEPANTRWGQDKGKDVAGSSRLCGWWAPGCLWFQSPRKGGWVFFPQGLWMVQGIKQNLMHRPALFRKVDTARWGSLHLKLSCCAITLALVGSAHNKNSVLCLEWASHWDWNCHSSRDKCWLSAAFLNAL